MPARLKACPFCGGEAELKSYPVQCDIHKMWAECQGCGVRAFEKITSEPDDYQHVADQWNTRPVGVVDAAALLKIAKQFYDFLNKTFPVWRYSQGEEANRAAMRNYEEMFKER